MEGWHVTVAGGVFDSFLPRALDDLVPPLDWRTILMGIFAQTWGIERDAIRRLADAVHKQSGLQVGVEDRRDDEDHEDVIVRLKNQGAGQIRSFLFKGTICECYSYLNGWLHATKEVR
jgi:hypothetical protein